MTSLLGTGGEDEMAGIETIIGTYIHTHTHTHMHVVCGVVGFMACGW